MFRHPRRPGARRPRRDDRDQETLDHMLQYLARRILWACVLFICTTVVASVIFFVPADPAAMITGLDLPVAHGIVVFGTMAVIVFNLFVGLLYAWIDPTIRLS